MDASIFNARCAQFLRQVLGAAVPASHKDFLELIVSDHDTSWQYRAIEIQNILIECFKADPSCLPSLSSEYSIRSFISSKTEEFRKYLRNQISVPGSVTISRHQDVYPGSIHLEDPTSFCHRSIMDYGRQLEDQIVPLYLDHDPNQFLGQVQIKVQREKFVECPLPTDQDTLLKEDSEEPFCVVCLSNVPVCVISPCNHKSLCCVCARELTKEGTKKRGEVVCPLCKGVVKKIFKIFE